MDSAENQYPQARTEHRFSDNSVLDGACSSCHRLHHRDGQSTQEAEAMILSLVHLLAGIAVVVGGWVTLVRAGDCTSSGRDGAAFGYILLFAIGCGMYAVLMVGIVSARNRKEDK